jgi:predicted AlkP superfamily pyrophosphatase or phosphodiesterase
VSHCVYFLTVPGLRRDDLSQMPNLSAMGQGGVATLRHSFPSVTWPAQANMLTGVQAGQHGVVANGFYWRESNKVEMWTAWNEVIQRPQIWDRLRQQNPEQTSAAWFPMLSKGCGADYVCMPAPIHQPDGSEELWCYTKPQEFYGQLLEQFGHFPLKHFWGPLANIQSSQWIADSAVAAAKEFRPDFFYVYLPHLDYAAQKFGPDSEQATAAVKELDQLIGRFRSEVEAANTQSVHWLVASEYVISSVDHVSYPNRVLREAGLLAVDEREDGEHLDLATSRAWALVDHQFSHVFVKDRDAATIEAVRCQFADVEGIDRVLVGDERAAFGLDHDRSGDVVLISQPNSWQAYYWWQHDSKAPGFARTVDIHRKPGYDPVELFFDFATKSVPLDATLIKGSHGLVSNTNAAEQGVIMSSCAGAFDRNAVQDTDVGELVLRLMK